MSELSADERAARVIQRSAWLATAAMVAVPVPGADLAATFTVWGGMIRRIARCYGEAPSKEDAIRLANATAYGLGAAVWSRDLDRARQIAARIEAGAVFINDFVRSDPRAPFGGVKSSGFGRELGELGARELANAKLVWQGA